MNPKYKVYAASKTASRREFREAAVSRAFPGLVGRVYEGADGNWSASLRVGAPSEYFGGRFLLIEEGAFTSAEGAESFIAGKVASWEGASASIRFTKQVNDGRFTSGIEALYTTPSISDAKVDITAWRERQDFELRFLVHDEVEERWRVRNLSTAKKAGKLLLASGGFYEVDVPVPAWPGDRK